MTRRTAREALPRLVRLEQPIDLRSQLADDLRLGLSLRPKQLPPRYFYDARGSQLFERITRLPEYYLPRAESEILAEVADTVMASVRPDELCELGSGSSRKTRLLLEAMGRTGSGRRYVAFDVSEPALDAALRGLSGDLAWLETVGVVGDFGRDLGRLPREGRRLLAFLGSTIGNLDVPERAAFLAAVSGILEDGDAFLLGVDLVKDRRTLEAAYDDVQGVTAEFNRNVLHVINRELDGEIPVEAFEHVALYDESRARIEMHLRARRPVEAVVRGASLVARFEAGETLRTEISCKFTREGVEAELREAGLGLLRWDTDRAGRFALALAAGSRATA